MSSERPGVLFVSTTVMDPLDPDPRAGERWRGLARWGRVRVVCFSPRGFGTHERFGCRFYTIPKRVPLILRVGMYFLAVPVIAFHVALEGIRTWVAQSPYEAGAVVLPRLLLGRMLGVRLIVEAHGDWIESTLWLRSPHAPHLVRRALRAYSGLVLACADGLRSVSSFTRNLLATYRPELPHETFPGYMQLGPYLRISEAEKRAAETNQVLYAGALTRLKGLELLREAWPIVRSESPATLVLCGEGPLRASLEQWAEQARYGDAIRLRGYVSAEELRGEVKRSRLLVLPSYSEGYGRVLLEAMAGFTPVVASDSGGPREILARSHGGLLVPVGEPEKLARGILRLLADSQLREQFGRNGRRFVEDWHDPDRFFDRYERLVRSVSDAPV